MEAFLRRLLKEPKNKKFLAYGASFAFLMLILRRRSSLKANAEAALATTVESIPFSEFLNQVDKSAISKVLIGQDDLIFTMVNDEKVFSTKPIYFHPGIVNLLHEKSIPFDELQVVPPSTPLRSLLFLVVPVLYVSICVYALKRLYDQTNGGDVGTLNTSTGSKEILNTSAERSGTTFNDIAGIDNAREVVEEVVDFMKNPQRYLEAGARLPTGILLTGPPGTGKTMLARAMANEAGLPFYYCSGSDFVEVYAGRGASRVRNLFAKAANKSPCVIFFDEIDALGKSRSAEFSMNEEREQTLNQMLACMDGFSSDKRVIVMAATNRFDILDKALVRPGRFDRVVKVGLPDEEGRHKVLIVHTRHMNLADDCDLGLIAKLAPGYSGAELAMIVNEAAIRAARDRRNTLLTDDFLVALRTHKESRGIGTSNRETSGSDFMNQLFGRQNLSVD